MRKTHNKEFKFKVALEVIKGDMTIVQIFSTYQVAESFALTGGESSFWINAARYLQKNSRCHEEKVSSNIET